MPDKHWVWRSIDVFRTSCTRVHVLCQLHLQRSQETYLSGVQTSYAELEPRLQTQRERTTHRSFGVQANASLNFSRQPRTSKDWIQTSSAIPRTTVKILFHSVMTYFISYLANKEYCTTLTSSVACLLLENCCLWSCNRTTSGSLLAAPPPGWMSGTKCCTT